MFPDDEEANAEASFAEFLASVTYDLRRAASDLASVGVAVSDILREVADALEVKAPAAFTQALASSPPF